jgi:agmatine deiminase
MMRKTKLMLFVLSCLFWLNATIAMAQFPQFNWVSKARVPAEWEPHEATWMQWPRPIEYSYRPAFAEIINKLQNYEPVELVCNSPNASTQAQTYLSNAGVSLDNITFHVMPLDNAWMRDNGPVWIRYGRPGLVVQDFGFNGWGGLVNVFAKDDVIPCQVATVAGVGCQNHNEIIVERGTLEFNGKDTLITSWVCLHNRNPDYSQAELTDILKATYGVEKVIWLTSAPSDDVTGGHVDGIARFINKDTVVVAKYVNQNHQDAHVYEEAATILSDAGLNVIRMDAPGEVFYRNYWMTANYVNWLVANDVVLIPGFGDEEWDQAARESVQSYFPDRDVHTINTLELWYWGGSIHCVTNDQPASRPQLVR